MGERFSVRRIAVGIVMTISVGLFCLPLEAQQFTGTLRGTVQDFTGALLPAADVTVVNTATNEKQAVRTDGEGRNVIPHLKPGFYRITAGKSGFKSAAIDEVKLDVQQRGAHSTLVRHQRVQCDAVVPVRQHASRHAEPSRRRREEPRPVAVQEQLLPRRKVERAGAHQAFNALNRVQFGLPNTQAGNSSFGIVTSQANSPRQVQFALKLIFDMDYPPGRRRPSAGARRGVRSSAIDYIRLNVGNIDSRGGDAMGGESYVTRLVAATIAVAMVAMPAAAQVTTGTLTGTVKDAQGAVVPGATVTLTSDSRGTQLPDVVSNSSGDFTFVNVAPDVYTIQVTMDGFKTLRRGGVPVSAGDRYAIGTLVVEVGGLAETVRRDR